MSSVLDTNIGFTPLTNTEEQRVYAPTDMWTDDFALKVAVQDFQNAESYRTQNQDWKWRNADEMYMAWVQQKVWEGTRIPRASIGVYLAFSQIEAILAKVMSAIFSDDPWFDSEPVGNTTAAQARAWGDLLRGQLDKTNVREVFRRAIKQAMIYGNGAMKLYWESMQVDRPEWRVRWQRMGQDFQRVLDKRNVKRIENKPLLEYVSIKDLYVDPNCSSPQVSSGRYYVERKLCTVDDLDRLRDVKPFMIPPKDELIQLSMQTPSTQGDVTKSTVELFRMGQWAPQNDTTVDPGGKRIEVLEYCTEDRLVFTLNRKVTALNIPNSYGFMPLYSVCYADAPDRFYAMGVCEVLEGEQRLQASLLNARLDELALSIHRPMIKKKGINTPASMMRNRPGQVWEVIDSKDDISFMDVPNITASAYVETQASENRSQKITGISDMAILGTPSSGGNSANRTAAGINTQASASESRIIYIVENLENTFIEPMLNDLVKLNQYFPPVGTPDAEAIALSRVTVRMRASGKMRSRMALMQTFPFLFQALTNPGFVSELAMQGVTPDWAELAFLLTDMTGARLRADLVRKLTPEEMKIREAASKQKDEMSMQKQRERIQGQAAIQKDKQQFEAEQNAADREDTADQDRLYALADVLKSMIPAMMKNDEGDDD